MRGARGLSYYKLEVFLTNHWLQGHNNRKLSFLKLNHIFFNAHLSLHLSFEKVIVGTRVRDVFKSYFLHATERDFFRNDFFTMQIIFVCLGIKYILICISFYLQFSTTLLTHFPGFGNEKYTTTSICLCHYFAVCTKVLCLGNNIVICVPFIFFQLLGLRYKRYITKISQNFSKNMMQNWQKLSFKTKI